MALQHEKGQQSRLSPSAERPGSAAGLKKPRVVLVPCQGLADTLLLQLPGAVPAGETRSGALLLRSCRPHLPGVGACCVAQAWPATISWWREHERCDPRGAPSAGTCCKRELLGSPDLLRSILTSSVPQCWAPLGGREDSGKWLQGSFEI